MGERVDHLDVAEQGMLYYLLLRLGGWNETKDLKDKVYALHSIFNLLGIPMPDPDYTKTVADVWEDATVSVIQKTGSLLIISAAGISENQYHLATWVPDWSSKDEQLNLTFPGLYLTSQAAGQSIVSCDSSRLRGELDLTGILFAKVKVRGPSMASMPDVNNLGLWLSATRLTDLGYSAPGLSSHSGLKIWSDFFATMKNGGRRYFIVGILLENNV
jgi:hypothetical protein